MEQGGAIAAEQGEERGLKVLLSQQGSHTEVFAWSLVNDRFNNLLLKFKNSRHKYTQFCPLPCLSPSPPMFSHHPLSNS